MPPRTLVAADLSDDEDSDDDDDEPLEGLQGFENVLVSHSITSYNDGFISFFLQVTMTDSFLPHA